MLLIAWVERYPVCKISCTTFPKLRIWGILPHLEYFRNNCPVSQKWRVVQLSECCVFQANLFYSGCVIAEVRDYRRSVDNSYDTQYVLLRPTMHVSLLPRVLEWRTLLRFSVNSVGGHDECHITFFIQCRLMRRFIESWRWMWLLSIESDRVAQRLGEWQGHVTCLIV